MGTTAEISAGGAVAVRLEGRISLRALLDGNFSCVIVSLRRRVHVQAIHVHMQYPMFNHFAFASDCYSSQHDGALEKSSCQVGSPEEASRCAPTTSPWFNLLCLTTFGISSIDVLTFLHSIHMYNPSPVEVDIPPEKKREWNRSFLVDIFPRIPSHALERVLDICLEKNAIYNLSQSKLWNAKRFTSIVVAHVRHTYSDYDELLRKDEVERYDARKRTGYEVWKVLREWCPWDSSNEVLERCWRATLLSPEERDPSFDPMDIDTESEDEGVGLEVDDPMDLS